MTEARKMTDAEERIIARGIYLLAGIRLIGRNEGIKLQKRGCDAEERESRRATKERRRWCVCISSCQAQDFLQAPEGILEGEAERVMG